ncbi:MAG TPA: TldD/PmbA family protein [Thermoanaerobaculia bacterium]
MRDERDIHEILENALRAANTPVADASFVFVDQNISRFANSQLHQNMSEESAALTLRVIVDERMGVASTTVFEPDELARTAELAHEAARQAHRLQNFSGLYRNHDPLPPLDTFDEATAGLSPETKARELRTMFDRGREAGVDFAGAYASGAVSVGTRNTHGVHRFARMTFADATVIALAPDASGYATRRERRALDMAALGEEATEKATLLRGTTEDLAPGAYDVILEPPALGEVFDWLNMIAFTGQSYEDSSSFFVGNLGKKVLGDNVTLADDAVDPGFLPFPFDMEGLPKRRVALVENGVIRTPVLDKAWADRLGLEPTGNAWQLGSPEHGAAFHLSMAGGDATREEMIRSTKLGIWVTRFNYVNGLLEPKTALMTGTTRDGTFLIRDGKVAARLPNLRWTQSMTEAFSNIEMLSAERRSVGTWYNMLGGTLAPVAKIRGWNITGKQESAGS